MRNWINIPRVEGRASRQAHADLPDGTFEHEIGREGFFGPAAHIHHAHAPTGWVRFEGPIRPRAFDTTKFDVVPAGPWSAEALVGNRRCAVRFWRIDAPMDHLARNADGDELLFIHDGAGHLFCDFGHMTYAEGDYILLPRGTMWRLVPEAPTRVLMIEATDSAYKLPDKGIVGPHAIFDPAILAVPVIDEAFDDQRSETETRVAVKRFGEVSTMVFPYNPLDAVGWHGDLAPVKVNWRDIRPLMSHRYHLPPSAHTTFVGERFVVCTFVPRPIESDPGALKVPFFHSNVDYDEFIFYHRGSFFSRDNIHPGMISLHPAGFAHGPHPKAFAIGQKAARKETDEVAVMIDTRDPLEVQAGAAQVEWTGYVDSWRTPPAATNEAAE